MKQYRTISLKDRLPDMGQRVMFLNENYQGKYMLGYHPDEKIEIKKNKWIEMQDCHFVTNYLKNNFTHWLEEFEQSHTLKQLIKFQDGLINILESAEKDNLEAKIFIDSYKSTIDELKRQL